MLLLLTMLMSTTTPARKPVEIVAHRGESYLAPENTLASVELAWRLGADAVEIDIYLSSDGRLVVCHDATTERTTGQKLVISKSTSGELRKLDAGRWKAEQYAGQKLPFLEEILATVPEGKRLLIEVKCGPEAIPVLEKPLKASGKEPRRFMIVSFNRNVIAEAKRLLPEHRALLISDLKPDKPTGKWTPTVAQLIADARRIKADGISVAAKEPVDAAFVRAVKDAGLEFHVWTIDSPPAARRMIDLGVDGVTTNRAAWMKEQLQRNE